MTLPRYSRALKFIALYFAVMHALPLYQMVTSRPPRVFLIVDSLGVIAGLLGLAYFYRKYATRQIFLTPLELLVGAYIALCIASGGLFLQPGHPASVFAFLYGIHYVVFPSLTFFAVKYLVPHERFTVLRVLTLLNLLLIGVGLLMHYWQPDFFTNYVIDHFQGEVTEIWEIYARLGSYLGSTTVGLVAGVSLLTMDSLRPSMPMRAGLGALFATAGLLSQQRGGFVAVAIGVMYQLFFRSGAVSKKLVSGLLLVGVSGAAFLVYDSRNQALDNRVNVIAFTLARLEGSSVSGDILTERMMGYQRGLSNARMYPLGLGVGATLSASDSSGANPGGQVVDANYMRILSDVGILGFLIFMAILATAMFRATQTTAPFLWLGVIACYAIIAIGTNVFDSFYVSHMFWALLAILDTTSDKRQTGRMP